MDIGQWVLIFLSLTALVFLSVLLLRMKKLETQLPSQEKLENEVRQSRQEIQSDLFKSLLDYSERSDRARRDEFEKLRAIVDEKLEKVIGRVEFDLKKSFEGQQKTFTNVIERLAKIDQTQRHLQDLSQSVVGLQDILTDKKTRGVFGEVQLETILVNVFGEAARPKIYELQAGLSNQKIVDALLHLPEPLGELPVDSKFPLENYQKMLDSQYSEPERQNFRKLFQKDVQKHITDIADKYLAAKETSDQAIMFIPAEAIFAEITAYFPDVIHFAQKKRVWPTSPSTFLAILTTIQTVLRNIEQGKYMSIMHHHINKLGQEFERYQVRWNDLSRHLTTINKDVEKIQITGEKIGKEFGRIRDVQISDEVISNLDGPTLS